MNKEVLNLGSKAVVDDRIGPAVVSLLLDETGSMVSIKTPTINGFNQFLSRTKAEFFGEDVMMNFATFSDMGYSNTGGFRIKLAGESIFKHKPIKHGDYMPTGQTNLIDSCFDMIALTEKHLEGKPGKPLVTVIFQTDGSENASTRHTMWELRDRITELRAKGWKFILLGAGIDNRGIADQMGIDPNNRLAYHKQGSEQTFLIVARKLINFVKSKGKNDSGFTKQEREQVGETRLIGHMS